MKSHASIRLGFALALWLAAGLVTDAQSNWPTTKVVRPAAASKPVQIRKPRPKRRGAPKVVAASPQPDLLRSMAELVTRQAAAIEALARRLEVAESRLEQLAGPPPTAPVAAEIDEAQAPFRAALSIDWAEVIGR